MADLDEHGNVLVTPGFEQRDEKKPEEILASYARFTQKGVTLLGGQGILPAGTALGRITASKKYALYDNGNDDGTEDCAGFLRQQTDTGTEAAPKDVLGNIVISGVLKNSKLSGEDANAITDLNARVDTARDWFIF